MTAEESRDRRSGAGTGAESGAGPDAETGAESDTGPDAETGSGTFCPACGDPVPAAAADRGVGDRRDRALCDACYLERHDVIDVPERLTLVICASCGALRRDDEWVDRPEGDYTDAALEAVAGELGVHAEATDVDWAVEPEQVDATTLRLHCTVRGAVRGTPFEESATVAVELPRGTCDRCGRIAGGDHSAVLQLRAAGERTPTDEEIDRAVRTASDHAEERAAGGDRDAYVAEVEESPDGVDVKLSTTALGRGAADRVARQLGGTVRHYSTLVTEDEEGDPVYDVTSVVRLSRFRPGDVVDPGDGEGPVVIRSVDGNPKGTRTLSGDDWEATGDGAAEGSAGATVLGHRSDAVETTLVAVEDDRAVQVLHPETYDALTVARPADLDVDADAVLVLVGPDDELYCLPRSLAAPDHRPPGAGRGA